MSLIVAPGVEFARNSFVHSKLANDRPIHPNSAGFVADFIRQKTQYYGTVGVNSSTSFTPPIYIVDQNVPTVPIKPPSPTSPLGPQLAAVPLPPNFAPALGGDMEAVIYRPSTYEMWEVWGCKLTGGDDCINSAGQWVPQWGATWGGHVPDMRVSPGYFSNGFGTEATGIAFLATIMTIKEQQAGVIRHPLNLVMVEVAYQNFVYPAQRTDGGTVGPNIPLEGSHWRFPCDIDFSPYGLNKYALMVATAIRDYGMIVCDHGGAIILRAENPMTYPVDPYTSIGGIYGATSAPFDQNLAPYLSFHNMPWDKLQVLAA